MAVLGGGWSGTSLRLINHHKRDLTLILRSGGRANNRCNKSPDGRVVESPNWQVVKLSSRLFVEGSVLD